MSSWMNPQGKPPRAVVIVAAVLLLAFALLLCLGAQAHWGE